MHNACEFLFLGSNACEFVDYHYIDNNIFNLFFERI